MGRLRKWIPRLILGTAALALAGWVAGTLLLRHWSAKPPPLPADTSILSLKPESRDGRVWVGESWTGVRDGLPVVCLRGSPFEIGYAHGVLLQKRMHALENEFFEMIRGYVPEPWKIKILKAYVIYRNRHLTDHVPANYQMEIYATTLGCPDVHPEEGSFYNRLLNYHAAHDVSYLMIDNPLISRAGCTAFGAWDKATKQGRLITGRNFDWNAAEIFSRDRLVILCEPDGGIPFVSLSWAGMAGVVTGMNRAGVSVSLNGAPSTLPPETATPGAIVARDVLQRAHNLAEALEIIRAAKVFVSSLWLVGSRVDGRFIVVEKTAATTRVREPEADFIVCANHFQQPEAGGGSTETRGGGGKSDSITRQARLTELIERNQREIDPEQAAGFLRDRRLPGGAFPGNGHHAALNAFIATHAAVMDLTEGIFWAASAPNQFGKFVAFDVHDFDRELPDRTIPADPALDSGVVETTRRARELLAAGSEALRKRDPQTALSLAEKAEALNPGFYRNAFLKGRALLALKRRAEAVTAFEAALAAYPAFPEEERELEELLAQARSGAQLKDSD